MRSTKVHSQAPAPLLLVNIDELLTLRSEKPGPRRGRELSELGIIHDAAVLCVGGKIAAVGSTTDALHDSWVKKNRKKITEIDCRGQVALPGFVDSHTHPVFLSPRLLDFDQRVAGAKYEEIAEAGGGIRSSVQDVRRSSRATLQARVLKVLHEMAEQGTTTVEAKSGYGLSVEAEVKSLDAIRGAAASWAGTVISTLLGAHVVPEEFRGRSQKYVEIVCKKLIPLAAERNLAAFVDVFTDRGAFSSAETEQIFGVATRHGLGVRAHVCQLGPCQLEPLLKHNPASLDHMDFADEIDIQRIADSRTVATLVPGANYFLGLEKFPPARRLIDAGAAVALATDYNPGSSPTTSMPFVLSLACTHMRMSPAESISAGTVNGAHALRLAARKGSIEPGKDADIAVFDVRDYREIPYWFASNYCAFTVLHGAVNAG